MNINTTFSRTVGAVLVSLAIGACGSDDNESTGATGSAGIEFAPKAMIDNVTDNVITATYVSLDQRAQALSTAVSALFDGGATDSELDAAQQAWRDARVPWESSEGFLFGPVDSEGIDPAIDSWPLNTPDLQAFLTANPNATQQQVEAAGDDLRGFHAIEFLLFGDGVADNDKSATELSAAELNYLVALAQAFVARTTVLASAWTTDFNGLGPYATQVKTAGESGNSTYVSKAAVVGELLNGIAGIADEVANAKIAEPFGTSTANADTSLVESQYSWNSLTDFHNNLQSILNVYSGRTGFDPVSDTIAAGSPGLYSFVAAHDTALADRVLTEIIDAQKKIALIKGDGVDTSTEITGLAKPFREQITDANGRVLIEDAIAAVQTLFTSLDVDVRALLPLTTFTGT